MGRTLDVLLGRTTKQTARLKSLLGLATKRIAVARAHRQVRCAQARGDVEQLLRLGHPDRALLRAEQVVRDRDVLDAYAMLDSYCVLIADRAALLDAAHGRDRECPDELREAAAGLVYAAARCGDLPELQEVRALLQAKFGRDFASAAAELRSGCGIDTKIVHKLSTKQPTLESRQTVLLEIGAEKEIPVRLHDTSYEEESRYSSNHGQRTNNQDDERRRTTPRADDRERDDASSHPALTFKDVEAAAQAAFESAATAAAAAKAAIELSRAGSGGPDDKYRRKPGRAHTGDEMLHGGGDDFGDAKTYERHSDIAENELKRGEQQLDPARTRPRPASASVRTNRGF